MHTLSDVGIIGGGPVGALLSIFLSQRGIYSDIYERRSDIRNHSLHEGRSINLAVSVRGLHALKEVGLESEILKQAIPMKGRMVHTLSGECLFQPYGIHDTDCIYSISRSELNKTLLTFAENTGKVRVHFNKKVTNANFKNQTLSIRDEDTGETATIRHSPIFASDGSSSLIRDKLKEQTDIQILEDTLDYGYKELTLPTRPNGSSFLEMNALHIWPRGNFMLIALPNLDGTFTCTLFLPFEGQNSFETIQTPKDVHLFFQSNFPDVLDLIPDIETQFINHPTGHMVTIKCSSWNYSDRALLIGDAAHAIVPFFGQGMNCGFEDCTVLNELLSQSNSDFYDWETLFSKFTQSRKHNADCIAAMATENFIEMRDKVGQKSFLLQKAVEKLLQKNFPDSYIPRYSLVTFSRVPYSFAYETGDIQNEILQDLCQNIRLPEDVDLQKAKTLIQEKLKYHFPN